MKKGKYLFLALLALLFLSSCGIPNMFVPDENSVSFIKDTNNNKASIIINSDYLKDSTKNLSYSPEVNLFYVIKSSKDSSSYSSLLSSFNSSYCNYPYCNPITGAKVDGSPLVEYKSGDTIYGLYDVSSVSIPNDILIGLIATTSYMSPSSNFYYINQSLTFSNSEQRFPIARSRGAAECINNYAIFAGGENGNSTYYNNVDIFNTSLTRSNGAALSTNKGAMASAHTSNYAMFGGGYPRTNLAIDIYDTSLTHTSTIDTSVQEQSMIGASVGDYILFAGGLKTAVQIYSA